MSSRKRSQCNKTGSPERIGLTAAILPPATKLTCREEMQRDNDRQDGPGEV